MIKKYLSKISLVLNNLVILVGVVYLKWNASSVFLLYWIETLVIGIFTVFKVFLTKDIEKKRFYTKQEIVKRGRFINLFIFGELIFIFTTFFSFTISVGLPSFFIENVEFELNLFISIISMFLSHGISFMVNFFLPKVYLKTSTDFLFENIFNRLLVLALVNVFGGIIFISTMSTTMPLVLFIIIRTLVDLSSHTHEHGRLNLISLNKRYEQIILEEYRYLSQNSQWEEYINNLSEVERHLVIEALRNQGIKILGNF